MIRTISLLAIAALASAAPVPESAEFKLKGWGDPINPLHDCKFVVEDRTLSINIPGKPRDLDCESGEMNAPRVLREKECDFTISVTVGGTWPAKGKVNNELIVPFFSAGLLLYGDDKNFIRFEKGQLEWGKKSYYVRLEHWQNGENVKSYRPKNGEFNVDKPVHLKLVRKGGTVTGSFSLDGKAWTELEPLAPTLGKTVKAGVVAVHDTETEFKPVFSNLKIE